MNSTQWIPPAGSSEYTYPSTQNPKDRIERFQDIRNRAITITQKAKEQEDVLGDAYFETFFSFFSCRNLFRPFLVSENQSDDSEVDENNDPVNQSDETKEYYPSITPSQITLAVMIIGYIVKKSVLNI